MTASYNSNLLAAILQKHEEEILNDWLRQQMGSPTLRRVALKERELREQSREFLATVATALQSNTPENIYAPAWENAREHLAAFSRGRAKQGFAPSETANYVLSLKEPLFTIFRRETGADADALAENVWTATITLDGLALYTMEVFQKGREEVILRQQQELLELSTPVVRLWEGVLALPLIGTLDSARTQVVMESLLQEIVNTGAPIAIIDITGVPTVDTLVAQHLLKTVAAARLMGADCVISGIRPQIAQTIVHLGVDLGDVITKATLADAFQLALQRRSMAVVPV